MNPTKSTITVAGRNVSLLRAGPSTGEPVLLVHGGRAGLSPIASGIHVWDRAIPYLASGRPVIALDLPGAGQSDVGSVDILSVDKLGEHLIAVLDALSVGSVHFVGHDLGGFIGLWLAISAPEKLRSLSIVASGMAPPTGDSLNDIVFDALPLPMWSRGSQEWALERVSYSNGHIDEALLSSCIDAASGKAHGEAVKAMQDEKLKARNYGIGAIKGKIWAALRDKGLSVPVQLVWGSHDPQAAREGAYVLYKILAEKQRAAHFHLINRAGSYPFREQPAEFAHVVAAFHDGVDLEKVA